MDYLADPASADPSAEPAGQRASRVALVGVLLTLIVGGGWLLGFAPVTARSTPDGSAAAVVQAAADTAALPEPAGPVVAAPGTAAPGGSMGDRPDMLAGWAARMSAATGIPARAVQGYGHAELATRQRQPACRLSWNTLAGIGKVESNHGRHGGADLRADGTESRPVIGVPLDGSPGVQAIPDTDHGLLDGDSSFDHAVGPMQFLPSTWRLIADPGADPQNIDAAALAAARYLCAQGRDLATGRGWWSAVLSYNDSRAYGALVREFADSYAIASRTVS